MKPLWKPKEYQSLGVDHLLGRKDALLFAGCGLGKTSMCLQAAAEKLLLGDARGFLVVAPLRVAEMTWPLEAAKWRNFSWMRVVSLRDKANMKALASGSLRGDIFCINYEQLPNLAAALKGVRFTHWPFDHVIWDEINYAKNPKSKRIRAANVYLQKAAGRWGLTGTPTPNSLLELFAQVRLIDDGAALGRTFSGYRDRYFEATDFMRRSWAPFPWSRAKIQERLGDLALTLRSEDWLDVPEIDEGDLPVSMPKEAADFYSVLEKDLVAKLRDEEISAANAAVLVGKLLQATSGAVYGEDGEWTELHRAKADAAAKFVASSKGPVLVACGFRHEQERMAKAIPGSVLFGSAKGGDALRRTLADWKAGRIRALVSHPASIGHGIDGLQDGGSTVLWTTLPWSRGLYDQLNSRIRRMGQEEHTVVRRLLVPGTIDFVVAEALRAKADEQSGLLEALALLRKKI